MGWLLAGGRWGKISSMGMARDLSFKMLSSPAWSIIPTMAFCPTDQTGEPLLPGRRLFFMVLSCHLGSFPRVVLSTIRQSSPSRLEAPSPSEVLQS